MIVVVILALAILFAIRYKKTKSDGSIFSSCVFSCLFVFLVLLGLISYTKSKADIAKLQQRYDSIIYEIEQEDDFSWSIHNDITNWNEDVAYGKKYERDFWFGIIRPNVYSNFELIDYGVNK